ncbi:hypothetical protein IWX65_003232 [Arthrobacter sp. CAN_A214]|uniref:GAF domain-containing protein n=1 Tax=Arthrobacter sp. CAN_A214 TaxID=2787720 RepID=UPI0018C8F809
MDHQVQVKQMSAALMEAHLSVSDVWVRYYALGGAMSMFEVQAYLSGLFDLPAGERNVLADATNELLEETPVPIRVPQSSDDDDDEASMGGADEVDGSADDSRRALGAAGAFLFTPEEAEQERLDALTRTHLLDTVAEDRFDQYTRQAKDYFRVSSAIIALIDGHRQFLKSVIGPIEQNLPRETSFCNATIRNAGPLIVEDALEDERFAKNPLVTGKPFIRFYAGFPLRGPGGWTIGTLCVIDQNPRDFTGRDGRFLRNLAHQVETELNT